MKEITIDDIKKFNKKTNLKVPKKSINDKALNKSIIKENKNKFNIELPDSYRYNQEKNETCWIYAGFNFIKYNVSNNLNINPKDLILSSNYINFYTRLEKINYIYEKIINTKNVSINKLNKEHVIYLYDSGYFELFKKIINKYGLVPNEVMPSCFDEKNSSNAYMIIEEKVYKDIYKLIDLKNKKTKEELEKIKIKLLEEDYILLSKIYGTPPTKFNYKYKNKAGKTIIIKNTTPLSFKEKYLTLNLDDYINIGNINKDYYKVYGNIYWNTKTSILNLPIKRVKDMCVKQLQDNIPVYIGIYIFRDRDFENRILDTRLYNYEELLNVKRLTKEELLNFSLISMHHLMTLTGVEKEKNKSIRWKVEDSFGDFTNNGYYIMNDNFFDKYVFSAVVHKKYLTKKELNSLKNIEKEKLDIF